MRRSAAATVATEALETATAAFARATRVDIPSDEPVLAFDFKPAQGPGPSKAPLRRTESIKEAIVRWLDEQL